MRQTYKNWDVVIVDSSPNQIVSQVHHTASILKRMEWEGHIIKLIKADPKNRDIGALRNIAILNDDNKYGFRIDDDSWLEPDCIELLRQAFDHDENAGCVGPIVPYMFNEAEYKPVPEVFNKTNEFWDVFYRQNSFWHYNVHPKTKICKADHIASSMMFLNKRAKEIGLHPEVYGSTGFREETEFSLKFKVYGYNNYMVPNAIVWHLAAPSGGGRDAYQTQDHRDIQAQNDELFRRRMNDLHLQKKSTK